MEIYATDRAAWLEARLKYLSASEAAVALRLEQGRAKLLKVKAGLIEADPDNEIGDLAQVAAGRHIEAGIFEWFKEDTVHTSGEMFGKLIVCPTNPHLAATPDALLDGDPVELKLVGETAVVNWFVEGQKTNARGESAWEERGLEPPTLLDMALRMPPDNTITSPDKDDLRTLWRRAREEQNRVWRSLREGGFSAPPKYQVQLQVQMMCLGASSGWLVGCLGGTRRVDLLYARCESLVDEIDSEAYIFSRDVERLREKNT
jgi:hypothetical protein